VENGYPSREPGAPPRFWQPLPFVFRRGFPVVASAACRRIRSRSYSSREVPSVGCDDCAFPWCGVRACCSTVRLQSHAWARVGFPFFSICECELVMVTVHVSAEWALLRVEFMPTAICFGPSERPRRRTVRRIFLF
jgi:hypothetical protein